MLKFASNPVKTGSTAGVLMLLIACSGAPETNSPVVPPPEISSTNKLVLEGIQRAEKEGITKTAYNVGGSIGAYGRQLLTAGWTLIPVENMNGLENLPKTIVYVNNSPSLDVASLAAQLTSYKGVLVVDSDLIIDPDDVSADGVISDEAIAPASQLIRNLVPDMSNAVPRGTAIMTSRTVHSMFALKVESNGLINGFELENSYPVQPQLYALRAVDSAAAAAVGNEKQLPSGQDITKDVCGKLHGVICCGRYRVYGYRDAQGTFLAARKWLDVIVDTGSDESSMLVGGVGGGVYPENNAGAVRISTSDGGNNIRVLSPPHRYYTRVKVNPAIQVASWQPNAAYYSSDACKSNDSFETIYTTSSSFGAGVSFNLGIFNMNFSGDSSASRAYLKRTFPWVGADGWNLTGTVGAVRTGIDAVAQGIRGASPTVNKITGNSGAGYDILVRSILNGLHCFRYSSGGDYHYEDLNLGNTDGSVKSKIAWSGWKPGISTTFEIKKNYFTSSTDTTHTVSCQVDIGGSRWNWPMKYVSTGVMGPPKTTSGYVVPNTDYQYGTHNHTHDVAPTSKATLLDFVISETVYIYASSFTNN